ncbi:predicted protein [Postia placenta Mad-698-R]|nr:predicted protein [Postia placenta Mad-698-R]
MPVYYIFLGLCAIGRAAPSMGRPTSAVAGFAMLPPSRRSFVADSLYVYENDLQFGVTSDGILLKGPPMRRDTDLDSLYFGTAMGECLQHFSPQPLERHASHLASSARKPGRRGYHDYVHSRPTRRFGDVANTMTSSVDLDHIGYLSRKRFFDATGRTGTCALDVVLSSSNAWVWKQQGSCMFAGNLDRPYHAPLNDWPVYSNSLHRANATWIEHIRVSDGKSAFTNTITESVAEAVTCTGNIHHLQSRIQERRREIHQNGYQHCGATVMSAKDSSAVFRPNLGARTSIQKATAGPFKIAA